MLNRIIEFSVKNKLIVGIFILALLGYGIYELKRLPIDAVPDITNNQVQIITVAPALGAVDVERLITFPLEQANSNLPHLKELRSYSTFGLSVITVVLEDDVDVYWARQQIAERLQSVQDDLPKGFGTPFLAPVTTGLGEIYQYVVRPKEGYEGKYSPMDLRSIQDWIVRKQLLGVKGVADVSSFGGLLKQYEIAVNPSKLLSYNTTVTEVFQALERNNENTGGSYIEKGPTALFVRSEGLVGSVEDIEQIVVKNLPNGIPLLIRDIATVQLGHATRYGALTYNGELQVSGAVVMMLKGQNSNEVVRSVKERIEQIKQSLPEGITIEPFIDRTKMVNHAISTVAKNLLEGALIVVFVLVLFLGNIRAGLLVASVIPLSMLFAIIMMNIFGVSGNLMSLGALDFGLIVDGAVIIVEAVLHYLVPAHVRNAAKKRSQAEIDTLVTTSASRMMNSAVFGQIIILIVYLPIFTLQGIEGKMFKPMAQTVAFALTGAFILSLTYIPMMSSLILGKKVKVEKSFSDRMMVRLENGYTHLLKMVLRAQKVVITAVCLLFAFALVLLSRLGGEFIPSLPEGDFAVEVRILQGSNLQASVDAASKASKILLQKFPEVERIVTKTGSSEVPTDPMPLFASDMIVVLKNRNEWTSAKNYEELEAQMTKELEVLPGVNFSFQFPVAMRFNELISGAKQDVVCKIFGENMDTLAFYANKLGKLCHGVEGSSGVYVEDVAGLPQITIRYNRAAMAQYGLNVADVNKVITTAFAGERAGTVYEEEKRFDLVVRLDSNLRKELSDVQNLLIPTAQGTQIPLSVFAEVAIEDGLNQIQRENSQRRIIVGFNVRGRDVQSMVNELQDKVHAHIKLPAGYYITYGGAFENLEAAKSRLYIAVPLSLCLILLLLYIAFGSLRQGLLIFTAIPLSAIGGILTLVLRGLPFSISAGIGFIALFGVAVLNGIVLISEFNRLKKEGHTNLLHIVLEGTRLRLRPVLMTASVASLGFLPMALSMGEGAEVQRPLATVVIGGLLLATFLTLFVLPILYIMSRKKQFHKKLLMLALLLSALSFASQSHSQSLITLQQAIDTAFANNLSLKNEYLKLQYREHLSRSWLDIPATNISGEYGQINTVNTDTRISLGQSISFPTVYKRQKELLQEEWSSASTQVGLQKTMLKRQVSEQYFMLQYLYSKKALLLRVDSLFASFQEKALLRFKAGESNVLENATAHTQRGQIALQLTQLEYDLEQEQLQFQLLLNTPTRFIPHDEGAATKLVSLVDSGMMQEHPYLQYWKQQEQIAKAATRLERAHLLPEVNLAYNLMSMKGEGANNHSYNGYPRFQSIQMGLNIPIFVSSQMAKINAAKVQEAIAANEYEIHATKLMRDFLTALNAYRCSEQAVKYYESSALQQASNISDAANLQFTNGDINYLEWVLLVNQATTIYSDYIEVLRQRNMAVVAINYYLNQ